MSVTTVYIGNLDANASSNDLSREFDRYGKIADIWIARKPPGFAFIEYNHEEDAKDAVREMDGRYLLDKKIRVEISRRGRGARERSDRPTDRITVNKHLQHSENRINFSNLTEKTDWRVLKDFIRTAVEPLFVDTFGNGEGVAEFRHVDDVDVAIRKLDDTKLDGNYIRVTKDLIESSRIRGETDSRRDRDKNFGRDRELISDRDSRRRDRSRSRDRFQRDDRRRDRSRSG